MLMNQKNINSKEEDTLKMWEWWKKIVAMRRRRV